MSVAGYLGKNVNELRMPRGEDSLGIRFDGPVTSGEKSVEHSRRDDAIRNWRRGEEMYWSVEDYDPVLRAHCRLPEED